MIKYKMLRTMYNVFQDDWCDDTYSVYLDEMDELYFDMESKVEKFFVTLDYLRITIDDQYHPDFVDDSLVFKNMIGKKLSWNR